ncbi:hypothetical protein BJX63DRAFT_438018 [Aspergillus granulosus]|uniref:Uncharacterized protein n=1 Tax=Aspergillus granulosus TaxID=176169 RepID=A0ABR4GTF6_9EURO
MSHNASHSDNEPGSHASSVEGWQNTIVHILASALGLEAAKANMSSRLEHLGTDSLNHCSGDYSLKEALDVVISSVDFAAAVDVNAISFPRVRRSFDEYASATGFTSYWDHVYPRQLRTVAEFIVEAFEKLDCRISSFEPGHTLPTIRGTLSKYQGEVTRLWQILEAGVVTTRAESNNIVYIRDTASLDSNAEAQEQSAGLISDLPLYSAAHGLLDLLGPRLAERLTGRANHILLLFSSNQGRRVLDGFYGHAPEIRAATQPLCDFLSVAIQSANREPFHVLEIGAGADGTTEHLVPLFKATGLPFTYTFTDLSVSLVARARKTDFRGAEGVEARKLNVEEKPPQELQGRYHAVVSGNCVHATRDATLLQYLMDGCSFMMIGSAPCTLLGLGSGQCLIPGLRISTGLSRESRTLRIIASFTAQEQQQVCPAKAASMHVPGLSSSSLNCNLFLAPDGADYGLSSTTWGSFWLRPRCRVEEMAAIYTVEIKRGQLEGPYLLGWFSFGGIVAFEAARQLLEAGEEVEKLVLLDSSYPTSPV